MSICKGFSFSWFIKSSISIESVLSMVFLMFVNSLMSNFNCLIGFHISVLLKFRVFNWVVHLSRFEYWLGLWKNDGSLINLFTAEQAWFKIIIPFGGSIFKGVDVCCSDSLHNMEKVSGVRAGLHLPRLCLLWTA